jgi:Tfp pilus assembly protein PilN
VLNFAQIPFRNERLPRLLYGLTASVLAIFTLIHAVALTRYLLREQEELDVKVEELVVELAELETELGRTEAEVSSSTNDVRTSRIRFLTNLYQQKSFPWTGLFNQLETLIPPGVRIASISPGDPGEEPGQIEVNLQVVGRTLNDVLELVKRLETDDVFATVLPLREGETEREGGGIAATLTLQYLRSRIPQPPSPASPEDEAVENIQ